MTSQQKIQELAMAALRSAPPSAGAPKPATFMADAEKLKSAIPVAAPVEKTAPAVVTELPVRAMPFKDEGDPELRAMIEKRDAKKEEGSKRRSLAVTCSVLAVLGMTGAWVAISPSAQAKVSRVAPLFKETVRDVTSIANTKENFDKSLEKVAAHNNSIGEATRAMGVDPASTSAEGDAELDASMKDMMGGEGKTTGERNKELQDKLGFVGKLAGQK